MAKKIYFLTLCIGIAITLLGCGKNDIAEGEVKWSDDNGGTLEVFNGSNKDIVVFHGQTPTESSIMGGVRAGSTKIIDVSKYVSDFSVGGYIILRGMSRDEYNDNIFNLSNARVEFNSMATYKAGVMYRVSIDPNYMGDYAFRVTNRGKVGLELRKNSPEGEKVAYLPALSINNLIYTASTDMITLFPVYVYYNSRDQTVTTLKSTDMFESVSAVPRSATNASNISTVYVPNDATDAWEKIVGSLKSPTAYITVTNNVMNQGAYFTNSGGLRYYSQSGYDAIGPGEQLVFEIESEDEILQDVKDEEGNVTNTLITGGSPKNLIVQYYGGTINVPVLFENETDPPVIINGYNYSVSVTGSGTDPNNYKATIVRRDKRDLSSQIESL